MVKREAMRVRFIEPSGGEHEVECGPGISAMQCATDHGVQGIIGECGGVMACGTCHGYVDAAWMDALPPPSDCEKDMIEGCIDVRPGSRLTCQILLREKLDGLVIAVPRSQT